jgi:prevent-host-death family protein
LKATTVLTLPSRHIQNSWGTTIDQVKMGEPIVVTQHGRQAIVMLPVNAVSLEAVEKIESQKFTNFLRSRKANVASQKLTLDEINDLVHELRA